MTYQVEWVSAAAIEALADKRGRPSRDESPLDYCEADDAAETAIAPTFEAAVALARTKLDEDYFGQVRIERLVHIQSRHMRDRWDAEAVWHLSGDEPLDENDPEYRHEIDLIDDEHIVAEKAHV